MAATVEYATIHYKSRLVKNNTKQTNKKTKQTKNLYACVL